MKLNLGLNYLRLAGYVHRDISPGNCLVFKDPSSGEFQLKISDLEYARVYGADSSNVVPLTVSFRIITSTLPL